LLGRSPDVQRHVQETPMMSLWMSAANSAAGSARRLWMAEMQRQQSAMMHESPSR
jgi:hypothetical protein